MAEAGFSQAFVSLIHRLADLSGVIALKHFRTPLAIDAKSDASPVTIADRDAESAMREAIRVSFPDHGIIGEEHGRERPDADYVWILDPIDGTQSFVNGVPLFGTLIGLWRKDASGASKPWLGCINHPALGERWLGGRDLPTTLNGKAVKVRACTKLADATLYLTAPDYFTPEERQPFTRLEGAVQRRRYGGTDCYHYGMVASGWTDIACEAGLKLHDYAAIVPVLEAAGAIVSDWTGAALTLESEKTVNGRVLTCGDARVHAAAVGILRG
jgi:inositol-phosphate phosphatase / L-galactose 1-phosphate phosphatase / histidinol-phosphatase